MILHNLYWSSNPPYCPGFWWVSELNSKGEIYTSIVEVKRCTDYAGGPHYGFEFSFSRSPTWVPVEEARHCRWAGPLEPPGLEAFTKAEIQKARRELT